MGHNVVLIDDLLSIDFENGYADITIGEHSNRFLCKKEDEEILLHIMDVIANCRGLYGTDLVDVECVFEQCTNHRFLVYSDQRPDMEKTQLPGSESKAAILFVIGSVEMGLCEVNRIIEEVVQCYPEDTGIIFSAENSDTIPDGSYTLCVLE